MRPNCPQSVLLLSVVALGSSSAIADPMPTTIECPRGWVPAKLSLTATAQTSMDEAYQPICPLLEDRNLADLVGRFGVGSTFAYPAIPFTCMTGTVLSGTLNFGTRREIAISATESYSESAQRLLPVPTGQGYPLGLGRDLFAVSTDGPPASLQAGAAMTAFHLEAEPGSQPDINLDLLLDDHFILSSTGEDVEDFNIIGSRGDFEVSGRWSGVGQILNQEPLLVKYEVSGSLCLKRRRVQGWN